MSIWLMIITGIGLMIFGKPKIFCATNERTFESISQFFLFAMGIVFIIASLISAYKINQIIDGKQIAANIKVVIDDENKEAYAPINLDNVEINDRLVQDETTALLNITYKGNNNVPVNCRAVMIYDENMNPGWYESSIEHKIYYLAEKHTKIKTKIYVTNNQNDISQS